VTVLHERSVANSIARSRGALRGSDRPRHARFARWLSGKGSSGGFKTILGMPQNFVAGDRDQSFLLPPSLRDWVPASQFPVKQSGWTH
jgi:hypothetical protein